MADQLEEQEKPIQPTQRKSVNWATILISVVILILVSFIAVCVVAYFQLTQTNVKMAKQLISVKSQITAANTEMQMLQQAVIALQAAAKQSQSLSAQQAQLLEEWRAAQSGDLQKWHIAEAQYLVKLANDHLQFSHNTSMAIVLLQQADAILQPIQASGILEIRKSIAESLTRLQATPQIDVTAIYLQLVGLNAQIEHLPLPVSPLQAKPAQLSQPTNTKLPWWKAGLQQTWEMLSQIIIVRHSKMDKLPLVLPNEKNFLYQNLHAQMEGAMWAVLHRNQAIYQTNLSRMNAWLQQYFQKEALITQHFLQQLASLQKINVQPSKADLSATLQLFNQYFTQASVKS